MNSIIEGFAQGLGFITGVLAVYTVYDYIWTRIDAHRAAQAQKNAKRRRRGR